MPVSQKLQYERIVSGTNNLGPTGPVHMGYARYFLYICRNDVGHILAGHPPVSKDHGCEGAVPFAVFDVFIQTIFAVCNSRIQQNAAMTQCPRSGFCTAVT